MQNYNPQLSQKLVRFGDPIPFGESVSFVCEKGMAFEEDYHQTSFDVTCQVKPHYQSYLWDWEQFFTCWISLTRMDQKAEALEGIFWSQRRMSGRNVSEVWKSFTSFENLSRVTLWKSFSFQVHFAALHLRFHLREVLKWSQAFSKSSRYQAARCGGNTQIL